MIKMKLFFVFALSLMMTSCSSQSKDDALNGLYMNKFGQLIYFNDGDMHFYKSTFSHVFQRLEKETYKYENKKVVYKYDDITLNHEAGKVTSINHRGRDYKRIISIGDIIEFKNLDMAKILKRINENDDMKMEDVETAMKNEAYLKHVNMLADKISVDDMLIQTFKAQ